MLGSQAARVPVVLQTDLRDNPSKPKDEARLLAKRAHVTVG